MRAGDETERAVIEVDGNDERCFVFRYLSDLSTLGLFVPQPEPLAHGTLVALWVGELEVRGEVAWQNPAGSETPGIGVVLGPLGEDDSDVLVLSVRAIAYLPDDPDAA